MDPATLLRSRHHAGVLAYFLRRTDSIELAWELAAETWAVVHDAAPSLPSGVEPAPAWVFAVARETLCESLRAGRVPDRARRKSGADSIELTDAAARWVREHATADRLSDLVQDLQPALRESVLAPLPAVDTAALAARIKARPSAVPARARPARRLARLGIAR